MKDVVHSPSPLPGSSPSASPSASLDRRRLLKGAALAGGSLLLPGALANAQPTSQSASPGNPRQRRIRVAFLTDIHIQPERGAGEGLAACLRHAQSQADPPQLILTGGDAVMDATQDDPARATIQANLWRSVWRAECSLPVEHCIGNHDVVWNPNRKARTAPGRELLGGKEFALDLLGLDRRYRSFDHAGWHFIVLDSVYPHNNDYIGRLDDEQFAWLADDLAATPASTPVLVVSHIPILSICAMLYGEQEVSGEWVVPASWVHMDARRIKDLFRRHPNVKLCLSGHIHLTDRVAYASDDVTYICGGAVCGNWWEGAIDGVPEGYLLVDLYDDGGFDTQYVAYGWSPVD